ncbi:unnamed protein product [Rodentolepis nana]|uniref:Cytochrome c oxidase subunit 5B, mitochondrial n=1 Tax=Rodentolepis nana TaxID=102285 RepID=A0A0R3TMG3_RODNA|nr:unnamed protein product [Rodentolepis nana]
MFRNVLKFGFQFTDKSFRNFSSKAASEVEPLKSLTDAVKNGDYMAVEKIIVEQDPYDVRRVLMPSFTSKEEPNLIASTSNTRLIGCLCEPEADVINWMELSKGKPAKCYCGHWFKLIDFEEYLSSSSSS